MRESCSNNNGTEKERGSSPNHTPWELIWPRSWQMNEVVTSSPPSCIGSGTGLPLPVSMVSWTFRHNTEMGTRTLQFFGYGEALENMGESNGNERRGNAIAVAGKTIWMKLRHMETKEPKMTGNCSFLYVETFDQLTWHRTFVNLVFASMCHSSIFARCLMIYKFKHCFLILFFLFFVFSFFFLGYISNTPLMGGKVMSRLNIDM